MSATSGVVIVGAGLGAIRVAENLRADGYDKPITLIGAEPHPPYDRPPLSKSVLLGKDDRVDLKPAAFYTDSNITLRLGTTVGSVDTDAKTVSVVDEAGERSVVEYDTLVLATGLRPRAFPGTDAMSGVHTLRTFADALAVRSAIDAAQNAVVIGAGFIGCEVAASLSSQGIDVTIVEPAPTPLALALGPRIGALVTRMHEANGVTVRTGVGVAEIVAGEGGAVREITLDDGSVLPADLVVAGIGSTPVTAYLDGSNIELAPREVGGGIACDAQGRTSVPGVYAVGDVANWLDDAGDPRRVEHWNHTIEQAAVVAADITGGEGVTAAVPYFWSDQFDVKIQVLGDPRAEDDVHVVSDDGKKFLAYYSRAGILTAVVGAGKVGAVMKTRPKLLTRTPISELVPDA
ncbi:MULTISPECIES: NAD(P)/FAD-dependent oxidoreductase [Gordonia]|uniref:NAD(P)/FAD-dependent oxidoreductase n=1 Tax=Gordonia TaxID=2053 RepID=UPI0007EADC99|nr:MULTISPECIES: FAD/NAD(P)-binding oxidoreductase [Gordonia]OBA35307.1 pyridine nucleotide-disulfide oxidoreductase [Gordonia sp. 852002-51296_SCH5728562-b]